MLVSVWVINTGEEYSTNEWTSVVYAISFMAGFWVLIFFCRKPGDRLAEMVIFCMCLLKNMQQVLTWYWSSRPCYVYDNTLTGVELHGDDQGPAAGVVHLLSWKLPRG